MEIDGIEPGALTNWLWSEHKIIVTPIGHDEFRGIRVSPSVYTMLKELDRFGDAMEHVVRHGLPA
ncbi:MAG: aminotransferase, partial [Pseudomonas stutzeri]|nr:aminotransferase [Stutzerimonas stutzeri]